MSALRLAALAVLVFVAIGCGTSRHHFFFATGGAQRGLPDRRPPVYHGGLER
jgi:hypothetical protein